MKCAIGASKRGDDEEQEEERDDVDGGFCRWTLTAKVTKVIALVSAKEPDMKWRLSASCNPERLTSFKHAIKLKASTVKVDRKKD